MGPGVTGASILGVAGPSRQSNSRAGLTAWGSTFHIHSHGWPLWRFFVPRGQIEAATSQRREDEREQRAVRRKSRKTVFPKKMSCFGFVYGRDKGNRSKIVSCLRDSASSVRRKKRTDWRRRREENFKTHKMSKLGDTPWDPEQT